MTDAANRSTAKAFVDDDFYVVRALPAGHNDPLYPRFGVSGQGPAITSEDGIPAQFVARALSVVDPIRSTDRPVLHFEGIRLTVSVTRARVVFFCQDYDKGGGFGFFIGVFGLLMAFVSWVIRSIRASARSKGLSLAGQIRRAELISMEQDRNEVILTSRSPKSGRPLLTIVEFADVFQAGQLAAAIGPVHTATPPAPSEGPSAHQPPPPPGPSQPPPPAPPSGPR